MAEVRIISTCLVQGSAMAAESFSSNRIELTPWDLQLLLFDAIQKGLLLPKKLQKMLGGFDVVDYIKISLSETLTLFPPLAGRLGSQKNYNDNTVSLFVDCNNLGAQLTHAIADNVTMADILEPTHVPSIIHSFFSLNGVPNWEGIFKPLLAVQVTELVDGYFIGCTMNHCVADGTSFFNFIKSWFELSSGSDVSNPPVFRPWFPNDFSYPIRIPSWDELILEKPIIPILLTERVFHFTKEGIAKLKAKANSEVGTQNISSFQALLAHIWRNIACYRNLDSEEDQVFLLLQIDARERLEPPLPKGYFGNAIYSTFVTSTAANLRKNGIGWAAMVIHKHVTLQTSEEVKKWYSDWKKNTKILKKHEVLRNGVTVSGSPRFNMYANDRYGKPVAIRNGPSNKYGGKLTFFSGAKEGDIEIEVCLPPETLHAMGKDREFMEGIATIQEST